MLEQNPIGEQTLIVVFSKGEQHPELHWLSLLHTAEQTEGAPTIVVGEAHTEPVQQALGVLVHTLPAVRHAGTIVEVLVLVKTTVLVRVVVDIELDVELDSLVVEVEELDVSSGPPGAALQATTEHRVIHSR